MAGRFAPRRSLFQGIILVLLALTLAGCSAGLDPDRARTCRIATVALAPGPVTILRQVEADDPSGRTLVRIAYVAAAEGIARRGTVECTFVTDLARGGSSLAGVRSEAGPLSAVNLFFLQRFWLDTEAATHADPQPVERLPGAPTLPRDLGYIVQILLNAPPAMASYGLLAMAYSLIYGLVGRINLAFGEMASVGAAGGLLGLALLPTPSVSIPVLVAFVVAAWAAALHGVAIGRWIMLPLRRTTGQQGLIATVGLALVLNEYLRIAQGGTPRWVPPLRSIPVAVATTADFPITVTSAQGIIVFGTALVAGAVLALMFGTQFGRNWRAVADDPLAAALNGVSTTRVYAQTFALASALAGVAGAVVLLVYGSFGSSYGTTLGLKALLAAVLGGIGSVPGAFLGGLALGGLEAGWSAFFPIEQRDLVVFVVLAGVLVGRPGGLFGYGDLAPRRA